MYLACQINVQYEYVQEWKLFKTISKQLMHFYADQYSPTLIQTMGPKCPNFGRGILAHHTCVLRFSAQCPGENKKFLKFLTDARRRKKPNDKRSHE